MLSLLGVAQNSLGGGSHQKTLPGQGDEGRWVDLPIAEQVAACHQLLITCRLSPSQPPWSSGLKFSPSWTSWPRLHCERARQDGDRLGLNISPPWTQHWSMSQPCLVQQRWESCSTPAWLQATGRHLHSIPMLPSMLAANAAQR